MATEHEMQGPSQGAAGAGPTEDRRGGRRWAALLAVLALAALAIGRLAGGGDSAPVTGDGAGVRLLAPEEVAAASGAPPAGMVRVNPPVDPDRLRDGLRVTTAGLAPLPSAQALVTYRHAGTGAETTHAVLAFDTPEDAARFVELAGPLLSGAFGLTSGESVLDGVEDALTWAAPGFHAVSFRRDAVVEFVGTSDAGGAEVAQALAARARELLTAAETPVVP